MKQNPLVSKEALEFFYSSLDEIYRLGNIASLLRWDEKVYMPKMGAGDRAKQLSLVSSLVHEKFLDQRFIKAVESLESEELTPDQRVDQKEIARVLARRRKIPVKFVAKKTEAASRTHAKWLEAKSLSDFKVVKPELENLVSILREEVDLVGYEGSPYNALFNLYEPFMTYEEVRPVLESLAEEIKGILPNVRGSFAVSGRLKRRPYGKDEVSNSCATDGPVGAIHESPVCAPDRTYMSVPDQEALCKHVAAYLGFPFDSGRLDPTEHPFKSSVGTRDIRICTRYIEDDYRFALYSTIHEVGHALYSLGLPKEHAGRPRGWPVSLSIHESQSRLWENMVARTEEFTSWLVEQDVFKVKGSVEEIYNLHNEVSPSLIRVDADELTYSIHIYIRTLLEEKLICGELEVSDLPEAWNALYQEHLGIEPANDSEGVLQDIHWYKGSIGYFPTYALGNLFAAQIMKVAPKGDGLLGWLNENIHAHGMKYGTRELVERATGLKFGAGEFVDYLRNKFLP